MLHVLLHVQSTISFFFWSDAICSWHGYRGAFVTLERIVVWLLQQEMGSFYTSQNLRNSNKYWGQWWLMKGLIALVKLHIHNFQSSQQFFLSFFHPCSINADRCYEAADIMWVSSVHVACSRKHLELTLSQQNQSRSWQFWNVFLTCMIFSFQAETSLFPAYIFFWLSIAFLLLTSVVIFFN